MRRVGFVLLALVVVSAASASAETVYKQPTFGSPWDTTNLDVLIVPPEHGQLVNGEGLLAGGDVREVTPLQNSYLRAIERSIANWRKAIKAYAPTSLSSRLRIRHYVIGRDQVPPEALRDPEAVIVTAPHQFEILGVTFHAATLGTKCLISNARFFTASFSYSDMLNVSTHEFGHCLGGDHVLNDKPARDVMVAFYVHEVGARGNPVHCPSNLNVRTITRAFGAVFDKPATGVLSVSKSDYRQIAC